jgi:hypothetical protein
MQIYGNEPDMSDDDPAIESPAFIPRPLKARKGRGAVSNLQGRYEALAREAVDDGWPALGQSIRPVIPAMTEATKMQRQAEQAEEDGKIRSPRL